MKLKNAHAVFLTSLKECGIEYFSNQPSKESIKNYLIQLGRKVQIEIDGS